MIKHFTPTCPGSQLLPFPVAGQRRDLAVPPSGGFTGPGVLPGRSYEGEHLPPGEEPEGRGVLRKPTG